MRVACWGWDEYAWGLLWRMRSLEGTTVWVRWAPTPVYCDAGCSCAPHTHMASITASSPSKDQAYAAKQQPAPVSACECTCVCVCISLWHLNKLFLIDSEEHRGQCTAHCFNKFHISSFHFYFQWPSTLLLQHSEPTFYFFYYVVSEFITIFPCTYP